MGKNNFKPPLTNRGDVLDAARNLICGDRAETHGDASENFRNIADRNCEFKSPAIDDGSSKDSEDKVGHCEQR